MLYSLAWEQRARRLAQKDKQYKIDYTYQYNFAKIAAEQGVPSFVLVSAAMANANSPFFYTRIKGELEESIKQLPFQHISILRPPALIRKNTTRSSEKLSVSILHFFNKIGLLQSQRPMKTEVVAHCMVELAKTKKSGVFEPRIFSRLEKDKQRDRVSHLLAIKEYDTIRP